MLVTVTMLVSAPEGMDPADVATDAKLYMADFANAEAHGTLPSDVEGGWTVTQVEAWAD